MSDALNADQRVKLAIGSQFVELQIQQDRINDLTNLLAKRDATIAALNMTVADLNSDAVARQEIAL